MAITTLINKQDNVEIVRDKIADILSTETAAQQALATTAALDPADWTFRVYLERSNPWEIWLNQKSDKTPIVNITLDSVDYPGNTGNLTKVQRGNATYNVDCYGFAVSEDDVSGHIPGDYAAALESQRIGRLVRNILMSANHIHLGLQGTVGKRWIDNQQLFLPTQDGKGVQHIVATRLRFSVQLIEESPQHVPVELEYVATDILRASDGQVIAEVDFDYTA